MNKYLYVYYRLSLEDEKEIESNSITNQRRIVQNHISTIPELAKMQSVEVVDDGHTGTTFNRPGIMRILEAVRRDEVACIVVKDLSRFGRKYLEVSKYLEQLFPYLGVRFIAVGDGYDSDTHKGTTPDLDVPVRNMLNALYSKTVSKNVKSAKYNLTKEGKFIHAFTAFGYMKDPADKRRIIIDEPAAKVVRRIFKLTCDGKTPKQVADILNIEGILTPSAYKKEKGSKMHSNGITASLWSRASVTNILRDERYTGTFLGGKVSTGELGTGKRIHHSKDEWIRIPNAHPAIITQELWEVVAVKKVKYSGQRGEPDVGRILYKRVRCGYCNHILRRRPKQGDHCYTCTTSSYSDVYGCTKARFDESDILEAVKTVVKSHIVVMIEMKKLSTPLKKSNRSTAAQSSPGVEVEIEHLQATKRQLYERYKKGSLDKAAYFKEREAVENMISEKVAKKEAKKESLAAHDNDQATALNAAHHFISSLPQFPVDNEPTAEIVNALVKSVMVYASDKIEVRFAFADKLEDALQVLNQGL